MERVLIIGAGGWGAAGAVGGGVSSKVATLRVWRGASDRRHRRRVVYSDTGCADQSS